jgi:type IV pilus assembly protein PilQ
VKAEKKISLELQQADIQSVVRFFAQVSGKNIIISDGVQGKVTLRFTDVAWTDAFNAVLWSQDLVATQMGDIIVVKQP